MNTVRSSIFSPVFPNRVSSTMIVFSFKEGAPIGAGDLATPKQKDEFMPVKAWKIQEPV